MSFFLSLANSEGLKLSLLALLSAFFGLTPFSPFSPVVLAIPGGEQGRPNQKIRSLRKFLHSSLQGIELFLLFFPACRLLFPACTLQSIRLCGQLSKDAAADILPDDPAVFLTRAGVVESAALTPLPGTHGVSPCCV